jgi:RHS repeat-associated protein
VASSDADGQVVGEYAYGLFGQPNEALPVPYGFTDHRYESELGLTDAGGRFYDAKFGIFLSPDPIGPLNGGSAFGNRYSYVGYDPINFIDPTGFQDFEEVPEAMADCGPVTLSPDGTTYEMTCVRIAPEDEPGHPDELEVAIDASSHPGQCSDLDCTYDQPGTDLDWQTFGVADSTGQPGPGEVPESALTRPELCAGQVGWPCEQNTHSPSLLSEPEFVIVDTSETWRTALEFTLIFAPEAGIGARLTGWIGRTLGGAARAAPVVPRAAGAAESAFSIASRGGRHAGFLERASSMSPRELQRTADTLQKRIEIHEGYIDNPLSHVPDWNSLGPGHQQSLLTHWGQEIATFAEQQSIVQQLLR